MKALVLDGVGKIKVVDKPMPQIQHPADAVLKMVRTTICGSDLVCLHLSMIILAQAVAEHRDCQRNHACVQIDTMGLASSAVSPPGVAFDRNPD